VTVIDGNALDGVSATTLWTLHNRATEARRPGGVITDPHAIRLFDAIRYDYLKFGKPNQSHALRARAFDAAATEYLRAHPKAAVVALAEGMQTSFWRLDAAGLLDDVTWYSVDLPPVMALREQLLPPDDRIVNLAQSALDRSWMDRVDASDGVFITAEGLFMYLPPDQVRALITDCAARFPGGQLMFDSVPPWFSRWTLRGLKLSDRYHAPPMPFGITADDAVGLADHIPGVRLARDIPYPAGSGIFRLSASAPFNQVKLLRNNRPAMTLLEFGPPRHKVDLGGVPETALMTLNARAEEARRPDAVISDPMAVRLMDSIDFDFGKFGSRKGQHMALRANGFDGCAAAYLRDHPKATVVALAEGLQTSFWRLSARGLGEQFRWLSVDLPQMIELRRELLPASDRIQLLGQSALDYSWMDHVDPAHGVFITAEGLLMYLQPDESLGLIAECARRFPGGRLVFDATPPWAAKLTRREPRRPGRRYRIPPMPFGPTRAEIDELVNIPGVRAVHRVPWPEPRGAVLGALTGLLGRSRRLQDLAPPMLMLEFD
jgi:O-methyltransferase involved in polyketide biosynthesis